ncbi:MAG TPA: TetR/AcrR family transcriptional regulator C-terminal domain-containing protein [Thermoleophilia bacterium]|nr:TetR/AcrR family transcriptional regulator C-terminal domain-containing protein [Thermoleophilia bacterium]
MSPRKKGVEPLARERIVEAAVRIIDDDGLDALSMRRLGEALGVNPMAAYYHVPNKAALYDLVVEALMGEVDLSGIDPAEPLAEQFKQAARAYRTALLAHPRAIPILATRSLRTAAAVRPVEPLLGVLYAAGLTPTESVAAVDCIAHYILGGTMGYYHHVFDSEGSDQREFDQLDPAELPNLSRMIAEGRYAGFDAEFEFGLDAITRGLLEGPRYQLEGTS